jgi:hypothetical protein
MGLSGMPDGAGDIRPRSRAHLAPSGYVPVQDVPSRPGASSRVTDARSEASEHPVGGGEIAVHGVVRALGDRHASGEWCRRRPQDPAGELG